MPKSRPTPSLLLACFVTFPLLGCGPSTGTVDDLGRPGPSDGGALPAGADLAMTIDDLATPTGGAPDLAMPTGGAPDLAMPTGGAPDLATPPTLPDLTQWVDPFIGTASAGISGAVGGGNGGSVFPGAVVPWGMVQFSPDTPTGEPSGYGYQDSAITGFSLTHFSGAGCPNNGDLPILPLLHASDMQFPFQHANEHASPGYYDVTGDSGVRVELTATLRTGFARFTYPTGTQGLVVLDTSRSQTAGSIASTQVTTVGTDTLSGYTIGGRFCGGDTFPIYFQAQFDRPWQSASVQNGKAVLTFDVTTTQTVKMKIGLSYFSQPNAKLNLDGENAGFDFDAVRQAAKTAWNQRLNAIVLGGGSDADYTKFYTALYHTLLHPNVYSDVNGDYPGFDKVNHNSGSGRVQYANFSGWDIYRSEIQLVALLFPDVTGDIVQSLVNDAQQCGAYPKWSQNNVEDDVMAGDPGSLIVANAYAFGATNFDTTGALAVMRDMSSNVNAACNGKTELPALNYYGGLGYAAADAGWSGSDVLEYAVRDAAVYQFAHALGDEDLARTVRARSTYWRNELNANHLIEPRKGDGSWVSPLIAAGDGFNGNPGYVEGNAEQYTWMVPQDPRTLFDALGGNAVVVPRLDTFFTNLNAGGQQPYCYIGNEPGFSAPFLYDWAQAPWRTQDVVHRAITEAFNITPGGMPGNDDLGATSSFLVWSMLGMFPELPGVGGVALAGPAFPNIVVQLAGGKTFTVTASGLPGQYVQSATLDGQPSTHLWLPVAALAAGGTLDFTLGGTKSSWGSGAGDAPPSLGPGAFASVDDAVNNDGIRSGGASISSFDGYGWSYPASEIANSVSGASFTFTDAVNHVTATFPWPSGASALDNFIAVGQTITFATPVKARFLALLGSASSGPSTGTVTPHYAEGDQAADGKSVTLSDWTLNGKTAAIDASNQDAVVTSFRWTAAGAQEATPAHIFYTAVPLDAARTITSVTLPAWVSGGRMHLFSLAVVP